MAAVNTFRKLGDIVKLPLLQRESSSRIAEIWKEYHKDRNDAIGHDFSAENANLLIGRATPAPTFVFPIHRQGGHFILLSQFQNKRNFICTYLEDYKANPVLAKPYLTVTLHDDLAREKGIVLVRADIDVKMITKSEAQHTLSQLIDTYLVASRYASPIGALAFNQSPQSFDHQAYINAYPRRQGS